MNKGNIDKIFNAIFIILLIIINLCFIYFFDTRISRSLWNVHSNSQLINESIKISNKPYDTEYRILDTLYLENETVTCGYENGQLFCLKNDLENHTVLHEEIKLDQITGFFYGDQNEFYLTNSSYLYVLDLSDFKIVRSFKIDEDVLAIRRINLKYYILFKNKYSIYDENFLIMSEKEIDPYWYRVYILPNGDLLSITNYSISVFNEQIEVKNRLDLPNDILLNIHSFKVNDQELILFYDEEHTTQIGFSKYYYKSLYMMKINLNTFQITNTEVMKIGFSKESFYSNISDVYWDRNQLIMSYSIDIEKYDFPHKEALFLIKLNDHGKEIETTAYEYQTSRRYSSITYKLFMKDQHLIAYGLKGWYKEKIKYYIIQPTSNHGFLLNKEIIPEFKLINDIYIGFFIFLGFGIFITLLLSLKKREKVEKRPQGLDKFLIVSINTFCTSTLLWITNTLNIYFWFLIILFIWTHIWLLLKRKLFLNIKLLSFYLLFVVFFFPVYYYQNLAYHFIDQVYFIVITIAFSLFYQELIDPIISKPIEKVSSDLDDEELTKI